MENIDAILYINLEHRTDRNSHILEEIHKLCKDDNKIHRINAKYHEVGGIGCTMSHIECMLYIQKFPQWKNVLILEDDFTFYSDNTDDINNSIRILFDNVKEYDVFLLSSNYNVTRYHNTNNENIKKVINSQTTSSYILRTGYLHKLLQNFQEALNSQLQYTKITSINALDIWWQRLMTDNWYMIWPLLGYQYACFSDIEKCYVDYKC